MPDDPTPDDAATDEGPSEEFAFSARGPKDRPAPPPVPEAETEPSVDAPVGVPDAEPDTTIVEPLAEGPDDVVEQPRPADGARTRSSLVPILAAATAVLFVTTVLFGLMAFAPRFAPIKSGPAKLAARAQEEDGLKRIARRFAENFVSLSYETIDEDLRSMTADATSNFATKLRDTVHRIEKAFTDRKASSEGTALDAAVLSHSGDSAIVQVLLRRTKTNVGTKGPETGNQIVNVTLVKTDEGWKVDDLSQLGADAG